jgi:phosphatidylserine decarboxylase
MLIVFDSFLHHAPSYDDQRKWGGLIAFPFNAVIDWPMATPAGMEVFTMPVINDQFKKVFDVWAQYLRSKDSADEVLFDTKVDPKDPKKVLLGWLSEEALRELMPWKIGATKPEDKLLFKDAFVCNPNDPKEHYGYVSWDDFFARLFKLSARPYPTGSGDNVIVAACESDLNRIWMTVEPSANFWVKNQPYSLLDILAHDTDYARVFAESGGAILQAFLAARSYHRWHSPIDGTIVKSYIVPGTYFALCPSSDLDPSAPDLSQPYISQMATRALIFIEGDNSDIGLMCFVAIGMAEVSTCQITVYDGQKVKKGDELGMFHHGGSSHCLIFRPETAAKLRWMTNDPPTPTEKNKEYPYDPDHPKYHLFLRQPIARV